MELGGGVGAGGDVDHKWASGNNKITNERMGKAVTRVLGSQLRYVVTRMQMDKRVVL